MKNVLILTDFSENSDELIKLAVDALRTERSIIYLLNIYESKVFGLDAFDLLGNKGKPDQKAFRESRDKMITQLERCAINDSIPSPFFVLISDIGNLVPTVQTIVLEHNIDFILLGTTGKNEKNIKKMQ